MLAAMTFLLAIVTVFQDSLRAKFFCPRLRLKVEAKRPIALKNQWNNGVDVYWFRAEVRNDGNVEARDVQVYLAELSHKTAANKYVPVENFSPMRIVWSHYHTLTLDVLLPGMPWFCDFFHISDPRKKELSKEHCPEAGSSDPVLAWDLEVKDAAIVRFLPKGDYHATLRLGASNHPPVDFKVKVSFKGLWFDDEDRMFREGVGMNPRGESAS
jgi:hypothetical protein